MIQIQLAKTFVNRLSTIDMWYSANWKEFVWICKRQQLLPSKFYYILDKELVKGYICTGMSSAIARIAAENVQAHITRDRVLLRASDNRPATQWMFQGLDTICRMQDELRGKIHIDIFAAAV